MVRGLRCDILALSIDRGARQPRSAGFPHHHTEREKAKELKLAALLWSGEAHWFRYCRLLDGVSGDRLQQWVWWASQRSPFVSV